MAAAFTRPYPGYRFLVEVDSLVVASFSEVSGLETSRETEEYAEGGLNDYTHRFPKRTTTSTLTLKRGLTDSPALWEWADGTRVGAVTRKNVTVILLDTDGAATWAWQALRAYPTKWTGPQLQADQGAVAVETLELTHEGLTRVGLPGASG